MFFLLFTDALRRCAAQGVGSIGAQDKFIYEQRRTAALPVWRDGWRRKERLLDGLRAVFRCPFEKRLAQRCVPRTTCAAMRRKSFGEGK